MGNKIRIQQIFRPGTPIDKYALFSGRTAQFSSIVRAVNQTGQHVVMFGERGVGKTSLSKVLVEMLKSVGMDVISPENINCDGTDDFLLSGTRSFARCLTRWPLKNGLS
jgi:Holliday junction resolvasome RuvABC ATP-dependent DNA helicase subunit